MGAVPPGAIFFLRVENARTSDASSRALVQLVFFCWHGRWAAVRPAEGFPEPFSGVLLA